MSRKKLEPKEIKENPKEDSSKKSSEPETKEDNSTEDSSKKSPEPEKIEEHSKQYVPNPEKKKEDVKKHHGNERKSVPVLEGVKAPSLDNSEKSLQALKLQRRKKKKHNEIMQKEMITHFFKLVKKVIVKEEKIDPYFNDQAKKVEGNGSIVKVSAQIHPHLQEGTSDVSTSTEKNHDKSISSSETSTGQKQNHVTPQVPQVFKREIIDLTYDNACRNEMATQMDDFSPDQPETSDNSSDLSKTINSKKDITSTNSVSISVEDTSATSFNMSTNSINTFAVKMQHLNFKKGDDNLNEVDQNLNQVSKQPKLVEVCINPQENDSDQGKKTENGQKSQESYSHFIQSISPPSKVTSSSPV